MESDLGRHIEAIRDHSRRNEEKLRRLRSRNSFFHSQVNRLIATQVIPGSRVLDLGCSNGALIDTLNASEAIGVDLDQASIDDARKANPDATFLASAVEEMLASPLTGPDYVILSMLLDHVYDVQSVLEKVHEWSVPHTRVVITSYSRLWLPLLKLAEVLGLKATSPVESYVPKAEVENLLETAGFEITKRVDGVLIPFRIPIISRFCNRWLAPLPIIRHFGLIQLTVARPILKARPDFDSISIVVAARNEEGHIRELVTRIPRMAERQEIIFVEGGSTDNTWDAILNAVEEFDGIEGVAVRAIRQPGVGKGDAVRTGFESSSGDLLMILDADISVPPEELQRFADAINRNVCEFANGSRLVYPMDARAMRFLNLLGNKFFGMLFTFLLGQPIRDTLCGTKVLRRREYERIAANRSRFGEFDPFGDFDLLFGASALGLRIRDIPVHYKERRYGATNISRFRHGLLLLKMSGLAATKIKFVG